MTDLYPITDFENSSEKIAISCVKIGDKGRHAAILFKDVDDGGKPKMLHLAFHFRLMMEDVVDVINTYAQTKWVKFDYFSNDNDPDSLLSNAFILFAKKVHEKSSNKIPYAVNFMKTIFDNEGNLLLGETEIGLTCSTFIISVFKSYGLTLAKIDEWEARDSDKEWHEYVVMLLKQYSDDPTHVANVEQEKFMARYKPEEVTASSEYNNPPAPFNWCEQRGSEILSQL